MKEDFEQKTRKYYNYEERPKILKNRDKYEMNMKLGGVIFKKNPLVRIFYKIENKIEKGDKLIAFQAIRNAAF